MNTFYQVGFFVSVCFIVILLILYRNKILELKDERRECGTKSALIKICQERIEEMEKQLSGGRNPSSNCIGCKHLIVNTNPLTSVGSVSHPTLKQYNCRKNLRCREYEEETGAKPCL